MESVCSLFSLNNNQGYKTFFESFYPSLCLFAYKYLKKKDIAQDAFLYLWNKKDDFHSINSTKSYLYKYVKDRSMNYLRDKELRKRIELKNLESEIFFRDNLIEEETYKIIFDAIRTLPPQAQRVIELRQNCRLKFNELLSKKLAYYYIRQVQHNTCVMIGDQIDGKHPVVAVNDTRGEKSGTVIVKDADSGKTLFSGSFQIPSNGKTIIGNIPETQKQSMWLIDYTIGKDKFTNHYLTGEAPFKLEDYARWSKKLNISDSPFFNDSGKSITFAGALNGHCRSSFELSSD